MKIPSPPVFSSNERIQFAKWFIGARLDSLENDVRCCLNPLAGIQPAPFPAILYCFSVVDLLGSLYAGDAITPNGISTRFLEIIWSVSCITLLIKRSCYNRYFVIR